MFIIPLKAQFLQVANRCTIKKHAAFCCYKHVFWHTSFTSDRSSSFFFFFTRMRQTQKLNWKTSVMPDLRSSIEKKAAIFFSSVYSSLNHMKLFELLLTIMNIFVVGSFPEVKLFSILFYAEGQNEYITGDFNLRWIHNQN